MKTLIRFTKPIWLTFIISTLIYQSDIFPAQFLDESRKGDWFNAGYLKFLDEGDLEITKVNNVLDYGATNDNIDIDDNNRLSIMEAIDDRDLDPEGLTLIYFPEGEYKISSQLNILGIENIILRGEGRESSKFNFDFDLEDDIKAIMIGSGSEKVGIEDLYLTRVDSVESGSMIGIYYSSNCWLKNIESYRPPSTHISIGSSHNIEIRESIFHHAWNYGVGGNGYGISIGQDGSHILAENNIFFHLRHSMILSRNSFDNVFGYNYSTDPYTSESYFGITDWPADMCLHGDADGNGTPPTRNLFEGNIGSLMHADNAWGANGDYNTFFRNRATYYGLIIEQPSHNQNIIGNEVDNIDGTPPATMVMGPFNIMSEGNVVIGNTNFTTNPVTYPQGDDYSGDLSLYFDPNDLPHFLTNLNFFPPIGAVDDSNLGGGTNPAKERYDLLFGGSTHLSESVPKSVELLGNYPNPFNGSTTISFNLVNRGFVELDLYNSKGQLVDNLLSKDLNSGTNSITIDRDDLSSGVYYYTLKTDNTITTSSILLIK